MVKVAAAELLPTLAVTVTGFVAATAEVVIVKVVLEAWAGTVIVDGTVALLLFVDKPMTAPPTGAGPSSVRVAMEDVPPTTDGGDTDKLSGTGSVTCKVAVEVFVP